jgi:putative cofactor-binding repeat protein
MFYLYLYMAFSYGWVLRAVIAGNTIENKWEWLIVVLSPISLIIGLLIYL